MKKLFLFLIFGMSAINLAAQSQIDSLQTILRQDGLSDSVRAFLWSELSFEYAGVNPNQGIAYAD